MMGRRLALAGVLAAALVSLSEPGFAQCAMCRSALEGSLEGAALQAPLNRAILLLLAAPYLVLGTFAALVWRESLLRRLRPLLRLGR